MESYGQREYNTTEQQNVLKKKMRKRTIIRPLVLCLVVQIKTNYFHKHRIQISKVCLGNQQGRYFFIQQQQHGCYDVTWKYSEEPNKDKAW